MKAMNVALPLAQPRYTRRKNPYTENDIIALEYSVTTQSICIGNASQDIGIMRSGQAQELEQCSAEKRKLYKAVDITV